MLSLGFREDPDDREDDDLDINGFQDCTVDDDDDGVNGTQFSSTWTAHALMAQTPVLDVHTFAQSVPELVLNGAVAQRRVVTISALGIDVNEKTLMPSLEYHAWVALCDLEALVVKNPLVLEHPLELPYLSREEGTRLVRRVSRWLVDAKAAVVDYIANEVFVYRQTLYEQRKRAGMADDSAKPPEPPALTFKAPELEPAPIKSLPSLEFLRAFELCREKFNAYNLTIILVRSEIVYNTSKVIDFKFVVLSDRLDACFIRAEFQTSQQLRSQVVYSLTELYHWHELASGKTL